MSSSTDGTRKDLSTVSTILGLTLFCILVVSVILRRFLLQRRIRALRNQRLSARTGGANIIGLAALRADFDGYDDEPRTVAIGARATMLRLPKLWDVHLVGLGSEQNELRRWSSLYPVSFQLTTPHTTVDCPPRPKEAPRTPRLYPSFLFHHSDNRNMTTLPSADHLDRRDITQTDGALQKPEKDLRPHSVMISYLISMPDRRYPSYNHDPNSASSWLRRHPLHEIPATEAIPHLEIGTSLPIVNLPSLLIPEHELRRWWDDSSAPFIFPTARTGTTIYASPYYSTFQERRDAEYQYQLQGRRPAAFTQVVA